MISKRKQFYRHNECPLETMFILRSMRDSGECKRNPSYKIRIMKNTRLDCRRCCQNNWCSTPLRYFVVVHNPLRYLFGKNRPLGLHTLLPKAFTKAFQRTPGNPVFLFVWFNFKRLPWNIFNIHDSSMINLNAPALKINKLFVRVHVSITALWPSESDF